MSMCINIEQCQKHNKAISMAIDALKEVQQYRKILKSSIMET